MSVASPSPANPPRHGRVKGGVNRLRNRLREVAQLRPALRHARAYTNWARANYELLMRAGTVRARPLKLTFDPTNYCQLRCPLCPTGARVHDRDRGRAQRHLFEHLMEEVGDYVFLIDFFNWGEPLLNEQVEEFVAMASQRNIVTFLSSNLSLPLSDARVRRLVESGLSELIVSLDGASAETYGQYRRVGRFDLVIDNVRRILAMRRTLGVSHPRVNWQFLVFGFNEHEIPAARAMAAELGVDSLTFRAPFLDEGRVPLSEADRARVASWAPTAREYNRYRPDSEAFTEVPERPRCGWHYMSTAINWDGTVAPCCTVFEQKDDFGKLSGLRTAEYMTVVNNEQFVKVRDRFAGRTAEDSGLVCERCPTPFLMGYHHHLNRQIALYLIASLIDTVAHPITTIRRRRRVIALSADDASVALPTDMGPAPASPPATGSATSDCGRGLMRTPVLVGVAAWCASACVWVVPTHAAPRSPLAVRAAAVMQRLVATTCADLARDGRAVPRRVGASPADAPRLMRDAICVEAGERDRGMRHRGGGVRPILTVQGSGASNGTLLGRQRVAASGGIGLDVVAYASDGLAVAGLLCYPDDGRPHSAVLHVPGGLGGVFAGTAGDLVQTCINWAALHGRTAFAPSLRGQDGGEGTPELCLGEAHDVIAAASLVRTLEVTDPARLGLVGGSIGGCVVLKAAPHIPNLAAVVSYVPPTAWKALVTYHRTAWMPASETLCDGTEREWTIGGPTFADALDAVICGHAACSDAEYDARSPLPYVAVQTAPTLIVSAERDNVVPLEQQLLWSIFRQQLGSTVSVIAVNPCDPPGTPPAAPDVHVLARGSFHLLASGPISSGLLFLMDRLDAAPSVNGIAAPQTPRDRSRRVVRAGLHGR